MCPVNSPAPAAIRYKKKLAVCPPVLVAGRTWLDCHHLAGNIIVVKQRETVFTAQQLQWDMEAGIYE